MATPEVRKIQSRYAAGGSRRPDASYFGASGFGSAPTTAERMRAAATRARAVSRLDEKRMMSLLPKLQFSAGSDCSRPKISRNIALRWLSAVTGKVDVHDGRNFWFEFSQLLKIMRGERSVGKMLGKKLAAGEPETKLRPRSPAKTKRERRLRRPGCRRSIPSESHGGGRAPVLPD